MSDLSGKTVLVTGASGFIGSHLVSRLRREGEARLVLLTSKHEPEQGSGCTWVSCGLEDLTPATWKRAGVGRIDYVFHLGAFTPKSAADVDSVDDIYRCNLIGTRSLLESLPAAPSRFVLASTLDVYAASSGARLDEDSRLGPAGLYGASKLFCEQLVRSYARKSGVPYAILRYGHIFGPGEAAYAKLIPLLIRRLLAGEAPVLYGSGSAQRDFLYVEDAVEATLRAALSDATAIEALNIVRGESTSIRNIAEILCGLAGFDGGIQYLADKDDGESLRFDNARMKELLGHWEYTGLREGLAREVSQFREALS